MGAQNIILGTLGTVAGAATIAGKDLRDEKEKKEIAEREEYLKSPEGRIETAYKAMKEKMETAEAEKEAKRRLELELLTGKKKYTREEYRKILSKKLSGKVKIDEEAK